MDFIRFVSVDNLASSQSEGKVLLKVPNSSHPILFQFQEIEYNSESDYYWYGTFEDTLSKTFQKASILLVAYQGEKFGLINLEDEVYEYQELTGGLQAIFRHKLMPEYAPPFCNSDSIAPDSTMQILNTENCRSNCDVRVLALFTNAVQASVPNIRNIIVLSVLSTNISMNISGINPTNARLVLAGINLDGFVESGDIERDVERLSNNLAIQQQRANTEADIVVMFTAGNYGGVFGRVREIVPSFQNAYAIVQGRFAIGNLRVFAHEVGHLFGARHQRPYDTTGEFQHGYTFGTGFLNLRRHRTIMCTAVNNHIEHFSNPNVSYRGKKQEITERIMPVNLMRQVVL